MKWWALLPVFILAPSAYAADLADIHARLKQDFHRLYDVLLTTQSDLDCANRIVADLEKPDPKVATELRGQAGECNGKRAAALDRVLMEPGQ
jgi:hypothetical protein